MPDIFTILGKDHREVKQMLARLAKDRPGPRASDAELKRRKELAERLIIDESRHEAVEETYFWPAVRDRLPDGDALADQATGQEQEAKQVLGKLDRLDPRDREFEKLLGEFITAGREHIDFEETQVWPRMRAALSKEDAQELGGKVQEAKKTANASGTGGMTRAELYELARRLDIQGRSSMNKDDLARHVAGHHTRA